MYSQSIDEFVQSIYKWTKFTPQLEHTHGTDHRIQNQPKGPQDAPHP